MPIFWIAGEDTGLLFPIVAGATVVLMARWDPVGFMAAVERHQASFSYLLVDNTVEVLEHERVQEFDLTSLKRVRVSSFVKKLNPEFRRRWRELTGGTMVEEVVGSVIGDNNVTEVYTVDGAPRSDGAASAAPGGRVRATLAPRNTGAAGAAPAAPASAPALPLRPAPALPPGAGQ